MSCAHVSGHACPHTVVTALLQTSSHSVVQQKLSTAQTCATHGSQALARATPIVHLSCAHVTGQGPQSCGQVMQVSPALHTASPQTIPPPELLLLVVLLLVVLLVLEVVLEVEAPP